MIDGNQNISTDKPLQLPYAWEHEIRQILHADHMLDRGWRPAVEALLNEIDRLRQELYEMRQENDSLRQAMDREDYPTYEQMRERGSFRLSQDA